MTNCVRKVRKSLGMSGLALAMETKIAPANLSRIETGKVFPYPGWRARIADALGLPEAELFFPEDAA